MNKSKTLVTGSTTGHIETTIAEQNPSRWQKLQAWLTAFVWAMDYDPQVHTDATIRQLREAVARLETRIIELEGCDQRNMASVVTDVVDRR